MRAILSPNRMGNAPSVPSRGEREDPSFAPVLRERMPELDTIRGIAIAAVVLYHLFYWTRDLSLYSTWQRDFLVLMGPGQFGVNLFFVLSGFLITGILLESARRDDYYARFYYRRALRILPPYYLTLVLVAIFGLASRGYLLMSALYCPNLSGLLGISLTYTVLWSLGVEEHFYFLWPLGVKNLSRKQMLWLLSALLVLSPVSRFLYHLRAEHTPNIGEYGYYTWNNADGLALGAIVALLLRFPNRGRRHVAGLAAVLFSLAVLISAAGYPAILSRHSRVGEALQGVPWNLASAGLLCVFLLLGTSAWKRAVTPAPFPFLGKISYGLYLYHLLFFAAYAWLFRRLDLENRLHLSLWVQAWMRAVFVAVGAVSFAYLSRRFLEEPLLRLKDKQPVFIFGRASPGTSADTSELQATTVQPRRPRTISRDFRE